MAPILAREKLFRNRRNGVDEVQSIAAEFQVCPFELSLQMLSWSDIVICDFNYVFDPLVQLSYFRLDQRRKVLLIDELHNLVDRARGMYSGSLTRRQIKQAIEADSSLQITQALKSFLQSLDHELLDQPQDERIRKQLPQSLVNASQKFSEKLGFDIFSNGIFRKEYQILLSPFTMEVPVNPECLNSSDCCAPPPPGSHS